MFTKQTDFSEITFAFLVTLCNKKECGRPHPDIIFINFLYLSLPIKYKIGLKTEFFSHHPGKIGLRNILENDS